MCTKIICSFGYEFRKECSGPFRATIALRMPLGFSSPLGQDRTNKDAYQGNNSSRASDEKHSQRENIDKDHQSGQRSRPPEISKQEAIDAPFYSA